MKKLIILFVSIFCGAVFAAAEDHQDTALPGQTISHPIAESAEQTDLVLARPVAMKVLQDMEINKNFTMLDVRGCIVKNEGLKLICQKMPNLITLAISWNALDAEGVDALVELFALKELYISTNPLLRDTGAIALAKALVSLNFLETLSISESSVGDEGAIALAKMPCLTNLNISWNVIGDAGAKALAQMPLLKALDISSNRVRDEGAIALAKMPSLETLDIMWNSLGDGGISALKTRVPPLKNLRIGSI